MHLLSEAQQRKENWGEGDTAWRQGFDRGSGLKRNGEKACTEGIHNEDMDAVRREAMGRTRRIPCILGILFTVFAIMCGIVCFNMGKREVKFEMVLCSPEGDVVPFSIDAVLESSLIAPRQYIGTLYFNGMEYAAHQNAQRVSKLSVMLDRFTERLNDVTYAVFLRTGVYGVSDKVIIEDVLYNEENDTYRIWLYYHEGGAEKAEEYFGPASSAEEAGKIRDAFFDYYDEEK